MDLNLKGKVVVVTGAARRRGNGRAIALTLAEEGGDVACADINIEGAKSVAEEIRTMRRRSIAVEVDQSDPEQVKAAVAKIRQELGPIDILVNNAGVGSIGLLGKEQPIPWERVVSIDLSGPYYWIREVFDSMAEKEWGRIINISSMAGELGGFGQCSYSASKGGLVSLAKTAALEGARVGITANAVTLGSIATDMFDGIRPDMQERIIKRAAMRKIGEPQDVANIVAFLASDRAKYITGANIIVDGGMNLFVY